MNPRKTTIAILAALSVSLALADDFKTNTKQGEHLARPPITGQGQVGSLDARERNPW